MKKQLIHILLSLLLLPLPAGCIRDNRADCPPDRNVTLMFRYPDKDGIDRFMSKHESVVVAVYDETGQCAYTRTIGRSALERLQGDTFYLPAGTYRVVCWGNVIDHSQLFYLDKGSLFDDGYLALETKEPKRTSDPVMYAPRPAALSRALGEDDIFRLTVPAEGELLETIDFVSAHTEFKIYVRGLSAVDGEGDVAPRIETSGLPEGYGFPMDVRGGTESYENTTEYTTANAGDKPEARARFYSGNFGQDDPVTVRLFSGVDGRLLEEVYLPPYLAANNVDFSTMLERSITVLIEFTEGKEVIVTVSVSPWIGTGVSPEL